MSAGYVSLAAIAAQVRQGERSAASLTDAALAEIRRRDPGLNCFTQIFDDSARRDAAAIDARVAAGQDPGPLAGVPFAVKDLFDIAGRVTTAGAKLRLAAPPARQDAEPVRRLRAAGAVLLGSLNMDEFAYGFATVNAHFGVTRNPHAPDRLAGGSSGGSAAAVAAGLVPLSLGSDTNGSIRVPASLCGIWGIRPGDGAIPMAGVFPFVRSLDSAGPFARRLADLRLAYEILSGAPLTDDQRPPRVARLDGWFERNQSDDAKEAVGQVMASLGGDAIAALPDAEAARSAAFLITAAEGGALHLPTLRRQPLDYDPAVRDRLIAGAMLPAALLVRAQDFRAYFRAQIDRLFQHVDILVAAATPVTAPLIADGSMMMDGASVPARAHLGIYCQPLSLAGIPVLSAPVRRPGRLPIGVQFAARRGNEPLLFALAQRLESEGVLAATEVPA